MKSILDERLAAQNNGRSWQSCEYTRRKRHILGPVQVLPSGATIRDCTRCPVSIYSRSGRG